MSPEFYIELYLKIIIIIIKKSYLHLFHYIYIYIRKILMDALKVFISELFYKNFNIKKKKLIF